MGFFSAKQKRMAKKCSMQDLLEGYNDAEFDLQEASFSGERKYLRKAMKEHRKYEYALLYRNTPQFQKRAKRK